MILAYIDPGSGFVITSLGAGLIAFFVSFLGIFLIFLKKIIKFLKRYKKWVVLFISIIVILGLIIVGVFMRKEGTCINKKIIILGFDGLSPEIIEPMMKKGELPNFLRLKEQGSYRKLSTTNPSQSPVAWTGFATGQNPGKNGIFDFIIRDPKTYGLNLSLSNTAKGKPKKVIKSKCFWEYTSDKRIPTVIISHPITFPPDKVYGRMLSGMGVTDILGTEGTFTFYTTENIGSNKDIGGNVFQVQRSPVMSLDLIGPKVNTPGNKIDNVKVPFEAYIKDQNTVTIKCQKDKFNLKVGQWSGWKDVTFKLSLFKKARGIFKFYLVEAAPGFKLYISPINFDPRKPFFQISYPSNYSRRLANDIGLYYTQGMPMHTWPVNEGRLTEKPFLEETKAVLKEKKEMLRLELKRLDKGILFCYFETPDIIQHMFWRYIDPKHPLYEEDAPLEYKEMIRNWYKQMDQILGETLKNTSKEDILIVLSDHGFDTFRRSVHINSWLRKNGYLQLRNPYLDNGRELLSDIDWSKTKAYSLGFGAIYINQKGRELKGIVAPGRETELLKEEIKSRLMDWEDEKYAEPIISRVYKNEEIFWGKYSDDMADLYVGFNIGYRASWQTALGAVPKELIEDNLKKWSGSHLFDPNLIPGILFSNQKINKANPSIYDITPTILKVIGYSKDEIEGLNFDGESILY